FSHHKSGWARQPEHIWRTPGPWRTEDDHPVVHVSWNDAKAFCKWLSEKEGFQYDLPDERRWEFAARAGTTKLYGESDDSATINALAWTRANARQPKAVGGKPANAFGLYDMLGNTWEWCLDPNRVEVGTRVTRGGSWYMPGWAARCASRSRGKQNMMDAGTG